MKKNTLLVTVTVIAFLIFAVAAMVYQGREMSETSVSSQASPSPVILTQGDTLIRSHSPVMGPMSAPVTIVEFFDPSCESCRAFYPAVKEILARHPDKVRLVLRYAPFHQGSDEAVKIIEASRKQDLFVPVLEALLEKQPEWAVHGAPDLSRAWGIAAQAGLDVDRAKKDLQTMDVAALLEQDVADIRANDVRGTPTFFINGALLTSFGQQSLSDAVDKAVASSAN